MNFDTFPDDDSPDLSDEEIAAAMDTVDAPAFSRMLISFSCPSCGTIGNVVHHERRRRKPDHFTRVTFRCANAHTVVKTFRINWVAP